MGRSCIKGYTLIEILIVIFIVGIVSGVALLSIGSHSNKKTEFFVDELVQTLSYAEEKVLLMPKPLGLEIGEQTYQFVHLQETPSHTLQWTLLQDPELGVHHIPDGLQVIVETQGARFDAADHLHVQHPVVTLSADGEITPFVIYVSKDNEKVRYMITGDANGEISSRRVDID